MKQRISKIAISLLAGLSLNSCRTSELPSLANHLPELKSGFHWEEFREVSVAIPTPDGWHRAVSQAPGTFTGSLSLEDYEKDGLFKTGFTVQVIAAVKQRTGKPPSMLAIAMGQEIADASHNEVLDVNSLRSNGVSSSCFIRFRNSPALGNKITVHKFFVTVDRSDLLYIYTFESPNETWDDTYEQYCVPMMEQIIMGG